MDGQEPLIVKSTESEVLHFTSDADPVEIHTHQTDCKMVIRVYESHLGADKPVLKASVDVRGSCTNGRELTKELELEETDGATLSVKN